MGMMSGAGAGGRGGSGSMDSAVEAAAGSDKVTEFQKRMSRLEEVTYTSRIEGHYH